jgi:hypothetical protein
MSQSIEGQHDGRKIVLPVRILSAKLVTDLSGVDALALLDTGATTSGISPHIARRLELRPTSKRPLGFARGEAQVDRYTFRIGLLIDLDRPSFPYMFDAVEGFELGEAFSLDALIGMDILSQCDFNMHRNGRWSLSFG